MKRPSCLDLNGLIATCGITAFLHFPDLLNGDPCRYGVNLVPDNIEQSSVMEFQSDGRDSISHGVDCIDISSSF